MAWPQLLGTHVGRAAGGATAAPNDPKDAGAIGAGAIGAGATEATGEPARRPLSPFNCTSNTKSAFAGIDGGDPRAPYPQEAEILKMACSPNDN